MWKKLFIYYINVEVNHKLQKYIIDDYFEKINNNGFLAGFLEINALSVILNWPNKILENIKFESWIFYKKLLIFKKNNGEYFNINGILLILLIEIQTILLSKKALNK